LRLSCTTNERDKTRLSWKSLTTQNILTNTYDQETARTDTGHQREANAVRHVDGKHHPLCLGAGHGDSLYVRTMGKGSGQRRDI